MCSSRPAPPIPRTYPGSQLPRQEIVRRYQQGESMRALAEAYGTTTMRVQRLLRATGVPIRPRHPSIPLVEEIFRRHGDEIVRRYLEDQESLRALGRAYGTGAMTIRRLLTSRGAPVRSRGEAMRLLNGRRRGGGDGDGRGVRSARRPGNV